ncbi:energy transducer TonB family protein [Bacteroides caecigallinarum]|uniref:energy transducer TonB family protein n=1 Tax=Bacteroides caecigallinarum TaxID=1411144 RepID=UPI001959DCF3|nr:energy transducer TonB [Bacteroides caecigallinarum]MBM6883306.1 energy transducer TonB [Bacteroides caecigallinarum]MBM6889758.1 energy transducer TonB [Bacteroides caecigallinarum]MCF2550907.1 energy transducer TonB [Bacteroides caecigallinarum]
MKRSKTIGIVGTIAVHVLVVVMLLLLDMAMPEKQEEGGVPVMMGDTDMAQGNGGQYTMTEVDVMPKPEQTVTSESVPAADVRQPMITQQDEPSLEVKEEKPQEKKKTETAVKVTPDKVNEQKKELPKEKTEAEKRAEAEKAAAEAAANKIAGAFGKGAQMGSKGTAATGDGNEGRPDGNSQTGGMAGMGGYGTFDLNGRSLGQGGLPVPVYNVQEEGRVVVTIVVNPSGQVISTSINKRTNTVNPVLRKAAEDAARKARFNAVDGVDNQSGTITYYFRLR